MATATKKSKASAKKKVTKKTTTNLIIIDASGSMSSKVLEVKGGLKELLKQIKADAIKDKAKIKATTIVVDFSGQGDFNTLINTKDSVVLEDNISDKYKTRGMTALYDAIGKGFALVGEKEKNVFVSILTDGEENDSKEFDYEQVKKLIETKKDLGWAITFVGTTDLAVRTARSMGITADNALCFADSAAGMGDAVATFSMARSSYYSKSKSKGFANLKSADFDSLLRESAQDLQKQDKLDDVKGTENKGKLPDNSGGTGDTE